MIPAYTATYDRKTIYQGDTMQPMAVRIDNKDTGEPLIPVAVCVQLRRYTGARLVYTFETDIDPLTGTVTVAAMLPEETAGVAPGAYVYDVEYTMPDGRVRTYLRGQINIIGDVSRCRAN